MKIKVNTTKLGSLGAQIIVVGAIITLLGATERMAAWLLAESDWSLVVGGLIAALVGLVIVVVAAISEAKGER